MPITELGQDFVKLDGKNYLRWESKMRIRLGKLRLAKFIESQEEILTKIKDLKDSGTVLFDKWLVGSQEAVSVMLEGMTDLIQLDYIDYTDAEELWAALKVKYASETGDTQERLHREFVMLNYTTLPVYIESFKHLVYAMKLSGIKTLENLLVSDFLRKLPAPFNALIHALKCVTDLDLDYCYTRVQSAFDEDPTQFQSHRASFVASKVQDRKETRTCYHCGSVGHLAMRCPKKLAGVPKIARVKTDSNTDIENYWFVDSCASSHMTPNRRSFTCYKPITGYVTVADGTMLPIVGIGKVAVTSCVGGRSNTLQLHDVLHVEGLRESLISVNQLAVHKVFVLFDVNRCTIIHGDDIIGEGSIDNGVYRIASEDTAFMVTIDVDVAHRRFGHVPVDTLKKIDVKLSGKKSFCEVCIEGKSARKVFESHDKVGSGEVPYEIIVSDVAGPFSVPTIDGHVYYVTFTDSLTGYITGYLMKNKSEVADLFEEYEAMSSNRHNRSMKVFRTDNGTEYVNNQMSSYLKSKGILHQKTVRYTPQQNGISERFNRTIMNKVRCLLFDSKCPLSMWGHAFHTAIFLLNRLPRSHCKESPYELEFKRKPKLSMIKRFGCVAMVHVPTELRGKLERRAVRRMMVGYDLLSKAWMVYDSVEGRTQLSRDVDFNEDENYTSGEADDVLEELNNVAPAVNNTDNNAFEPDNVDVSDSEYSDDDNSATSDIEDEPEVAVPHVFDNALDINDGATITRSGRISKPPAIHHTARKVVISNPNIPNTFNQCMSMLDNTKWTNAMREEFDGLVKNATWEYVKLGPNMRPIGNKWVYTEKTDEFGNVVKSKARLVVLGNMQRKDRDYGDTYAPVIHFNSLRTILAVAVEKNLILFQSDVTRAFLNGDIEEKIYMTQPKGFHNGNADEVCLLKKSLYGLKQAPRQWNIKIHSKLVEAGFMRTKTDPCVYIKSSGEKTHIIGLYVDDIIQAATCQGDIDQFNAFLDQSFDIVHFGSPTKVLGVELTQDRENRTISFGLEQFTLNAVEEFIGLNDKTQSTTPQELNSKIKSVVDKSKLVRVDAYRRAIGSLMYISSRTRPDISSAVRVASEHINAPGVDAWKCVNRIFHYLRRTAHYRLTYKQTGSLVVSAFSDADWASCINSRRSVCGSIVQIGGNTVMWRSKKQTTTALSSTESEYMALTDCAKEVVWLRSLLNELDCHQDAASMIWDDNVGCIQLALNEITFSRSKHIDLRHHFIREKVSNGVIRLAYIKTKENVADALTKAIPRMAFEGHVQAFGLCVSRSPKKNTVKRGKVLDIDRNKVVD